jgi:hypothetical protein
MKKIIVLTLILAMAAGSAFAVDVGAEVNVGAKLIMADNSKRVNNTELAPMEPTGSIGLQTLRFSGSGESDDGTVGGYLRFDGVGGDFNGRGYAWWQPIEMIKLILGNPAGGDGVWGTEGNAGWNFNGRPGDRGIASNGSTWGSWPYANGGAYRNAFYGGFDATSLMLEIKPAEVFGLNIGLPYNGKLLDIFSKLHLQANVSLDGIADIHLTMVGTTPYGGVDFSGTQVFQYHNNEGLAPQFYLSADLKMLSGIDLNFGVALKLPEKVEGSRAVKASDPAGYLNLSGTKNHEVAVGLSAKMGVTDTFGFKARLMAKFGGSLEETFKSNSPDDYGSFFGGYGYDLNAARNTFELTTKTPDPFIFAFDVLPFFAITDNLTLYADLGIWIKGATETETTYTVNGREPLYFRAPKAAPYNGYGFEEKETKAEFGWHINPYVRIGAEWGPAFWVGINIYTKGDESLQPEDPAWSLVKPEPEKYTKIQFEIPIAIGISF